ncbi:MAG: hypothetical protein EXR62_07675 [Chloroflexi bacterium]|nr:hypothetical protein [Chloroflexota bacterium]
MNQDKDWHFRSFDNKPTTPEDIARLEWVEASLLSDEEFGKLFRHKIHMGSTQCEEAKIFQAYCSQILAALGTHPGLEILTIAKAKILDRYVHIMGVLPPSHYVTISGYSYPFHPCVTEVLWQVHEEIARLEVKSHRTGDAFEGLLLGYEPKATEEK